MNNIVTPGVPAGMPASAPQAKPVSAGEAGATAGQAAAPTPREDDSVQLTESAMAMHLASQGADAPVDAQRVAQVREAIADGSYRVDARSIAARLIGLEKQLG